MGLVRELEVKRAIERRQLVEAITNYLRSLEVDAIPGEESSKDMFGETSNEPVIHLKGQSADRIRLISTDYISCGIPGSVSRFQYEVFFDQKFTHKSSQQIGARTKIIKEKKALGLFGGEVAGISWIGGELADLLNHDSDISNVLLDCAKSPGNPEFRIQTKSPSTVEIQGPRFAEPERIMDLFSLGVKEQFENCVFGFKICDRIAKHVRELVNPW